MVQIDFGTLNLFATEVSQDPSFLMRLNLIKNGLNFFFLSPLIGVGPNMFESYLEDGRGKYHVGGLSNPHNGFVEILADYGIIVFAVFTLLLLIPLKLALSSQAKNYQTARRNSTRVAMILSVVLLPFAATMHSTFLGDPTAWLWIAVILVLYRYLEKDVNSISHHFSELSSHAGSFQRNSKYA